MQTDRSSLTEKLTHSTHSVDACLLDIVTSAKEERERPVVPPSMRRQLWYLLVNYVWCWGLGWLCVAEQDASFSKTTVSTLIALAVAGPTLGAFTVQYFLDDGWDGVLKLLRRLDPRLMPKGWVVASVTVVPSTLAVTSGLYVYLGGTPPTPTTMNKLAAGFLLSIPIAIGEEMGWRGMMLGHMPGCWDMQAVCDGWYYSQYGNTKGNNGKPFWATRTKRNHPASASAARRRRKCRSRGGSKSSGRWGQEERDAMSPLSSAAASSNNNINNDRSSSSMSARMDAIEEGSDDNDGNDDDDDDDDDEEEEDSTLPPHWKWSPVCASVIIGLTWGITYLPAFFVKQLNQQYTNWVQMALESIYLSTFYTWQSNSTHSCLVAAILTHSIQHTFKGMNPHGSTPHPPFLTQPNSLYQLILLLLALSLVWVVGPELGRKPSRFTKNRRR